MQYETIILELLSRIKKLEDDVNELKQAQNHTANIPSYDGVESSRESGDQMTNETTVSYMKLTDEMIDICYRCGKKAAAGEKVQELADDIADSTGMNRNTAIMYVYAVREMLTGTIYKRAISAKAMKKYYDMIFNEYGSVGLKKAIYATRLHIAYRRECGHMVDSIEEICDFYESRL